MAPTPSAARVRLRLASIFMIGIALGGACTTAAQPPGTGSPEALSPSATAEPASAATSSPDVTTPAVPPMATASASTPGTPTATPTTAGPSVALPTVLTRPLGPDCAGVTDRDVPDFSTSLNGIAARLTPQTGGRRDLSAGGWSDGIASPDVRFSDAARYPSVVADAGSVIRWEANPEFSLVAGSAEFYRLDADDRLDPLAEPLVVRPLGGDAAGLHVPLPAEPGRWLAVLGGAWQSDCLEGDGFLDAVLTTE